MFLRFKEIFYHTNFYKLFFGLFLAQCINTIGFLILPKVYSPQAFATFGVFTSFVFILIEIINLKLDVALQVENNQEKQTQILYLSCIIGCVISIIVSIPFLFIYKENYWFIFPVILVLYALNQPMIAYLNVIKKVNYISISRILMVVATLFFSIVFIKVWQNNFGLIYAFAIGQAIATLYLLYKLRHLFFVKIDISNFKQLLQTYIQFPTFGVLSSMVNTISRNGIIPLVELLFGKIFCGYYTMSVRLLLAPASLYQTAMTQFFLQEANNITNEKLRIKVWQTFWIGIILGCIPVLIVAFFGESIFYYLFDSQWIEAGKLSQYLVFWYFASAVISPISMVLDIKHLLHKELIWNIILFVFRAFALFAGYYYNDFWTAILYLVLVGIVMNLALFFYILKITKPNGN